MATLDQAFEALFYGEGKWLGVCLILLLTLPFQLKWRYAGVLFLPVQILMALDYFLHDLSWQGFILFGAGFFMAIYMAKGKGR